MQTDYLDRLPADVRALVDHIEAKTGIDVTVRINAAQATEQPVQPDRPDTMRCRINEYAAEILLPSADYFPAGAVFHELLHIERVLVDGVPRIRDSEHYEPWCPGVRKEMARQDNNLEHLVIVPRELARFADRALHWEVRVARAWAVVTADAMAPQHRRQNALVTWCFHQTVLPGSAALPQAHATLERHGLVEAAHAFCTAISPLLGNKERATRAWFEHLRIDPAKARFEYYYPRNHAKRSAALGAHHPATGQPND